ncbi:hypothetical protein [Roseomonas gilardii]|uniref:hypothetical protein n=1 Tax=Roseomonas gilardii TaxID=257708 RepID=UPI0012DFA6A8|nr:hypothetical protein [Roseomonas gilardii]
MPQLGPMGWEGAELSASEYMLPLGAEQRAEIEAGPEAPGPCIEALAGAMRPRLDHGQGFMLLRGLPQDLPAAAVLRALGRHLGTALPAEADPDFCDILLLRPDAPARVTLLSAASVHNALLLRDKPLLTSLYAANPALGDGIAFQVSGGVFAGYRGPSMPDAAAPEALRAALEAPGLSLSMQSGDVLVLNPFLVWLRDRPEASHLALRASQTRMDFPEWAPPMQSLAAAS